MKIVERFASNLKAERKRRRCSQQSIADAAGVTVGYISMLERGLRSPPLDTLEAIADALNLSPCDLIE